MYFQAACEFGLGVVSRNYIGMLFEKCGRTFLKLWIVNFVWENVGVQCRSISTKNVVALLSSDKQAHRGQE